MDDKPRPAAPPRSPGAPELTAILRKAGVLQQGKVAGIRKERLVKTPVSILTRLTLQYDAGAPAGVPRSLIHKTPLSDRGSAPFGFARQEIGFYRQFANRITNLPLPRCYAADAGAGNRQPWLLIEDLSGTHRHEVWPRPLPDKHMQAAVDALAALHAGQWQDSPDYKREVARLPDEQAFDGKLRMMQRRYRKFADHVGDVLDPSRRRVYESIFAHGAGPWRRLLRRDRLTLIHGDAHCGNFLYPRKPQAAGVYLIDWQFWSVDAGARDLAYMMALHWDPRQRAAFERPLLKHYHRRLAELGAGDYGWDELWNDYRHCVIRNLLVPHMLWERGLPEERWRPLLECAFAAFEDLDCAELLGS